jgi:mRNA-degrading endonuclease RelE of RelBE toxin-antitoxin system
MRSTSVLTISLPPAMAKQMERVRKAGPIPNSCARPGDFISRAVTPNTHPLALKLPPSAVAALRSRETATWRRRVGSYRIFFDVDLDSPIVMVVDIARRTSTTY